jgi:hypothetical protein
MQEDKKMTISENFLDPANNDSLAGTVGAMINKNNMNTNDMLPCQVLAYDKDKKRVQIQHLIMQETEDGQLLSRGQVASIPVLQLGGGGVLLHFNIVPGDLGWIKSNDRDISLFLSTYKKSKPGTHRKKSFSDAMFIPDCMTGYVIAEEDENNCVLQTKDGSVKISIGENTIKIKASENVIIESEGDAEINIDGSATINCEQATITATENVIMDTPLLAVSGAITAGESISPDTPPP